MKEPKEPNAETRLLVEELAAAAQRDERDEPRETDTEPGTSFSEDTVSKHAQGRRETTPKGETPRHFLSNDRLFVRCFRVFDHHLSLFLKVAFLQKKPKSLAKKHAQDKPRGL